MKTPPTDEKTSTETKDTTGSGTTTAGSESGTSTDTTGDKTGDAAGGAKDATDGKVPPPASRHGQEGLDLRQARSPGRRHRLHCLGVHRYDQDVHRRRPAPQDRGCKLRRFVLFGVFLLGRRLQRCGVTDASRTYRRGPRQHCRGGPRLCRPARLVTAFRDGVS